MSSVSRRRFMANSAAAGTLLGLGDLGFLARLAPVSAEEANLEPAMVRFDPSIEPLVKLLEETPRDKVLEAFARRIQAGTSYREVLAALLLAGVRNVQPRPSVGHKFHGVLVVNSAHIASQASPDEDRWLPIFWALDYFKSSQARDVQEGNWTMAPVKESALPGPARARGAFLEAMQNWDEAAADVAVASLARHAGAGELFELFARLGARDFRSIGHKAIYVANSWRTLHCIGWQHAEPVLRSLAYALLNHSGEANPATSDLAADRPGRRNEKLLEEIREDWQGGQPSDEAAVELLRVLRTDSADAACDAVVAMLNRGVAPQSVIDALLLASGELLMRQRGIVSLHAVTTTNALVYAYRMVADDRTRRFLLLQNAAFVTLFREAMRGRGSVGKAELDDLSPAEVKPNDPEVLAGIFREISGDRRAAASQTLGFLQAGGSPEELITTARRLVFLKGNDAHDYKFSSAVLEDYYEVSPAWRNRYLAAGTYFLHGSGQADNRLVQRTRAALG